MVPALTWLTAGMSDAAEFAVLTGAETDVLHMFRIHTSLSN